MSAVKQVEVLNVLSGHCHLLDLQAVCHRLSPSLSFHCRITCHSFLLSLWYLSTTLNDVTSNRNMGGPTEMHLYCQEIK
jgi:hypothetical protein